MISTSAHHHYNPDWLSDDTLLANFIARQSEFSFLRDELARAPINGSVQHYLLVGVRGSGKTTLLKRLAVAIRRDADLQDHLIALSFPEELYQVKNLADFWWAACDALADELDMLGQTSAADLLVSEIDRTKNATANTAPLSEAGLKLLLETCARLGRRPVLLVDNLDMVFQRIDKTGRKLKNPHSTAYWALREALSTTVSPIVVGGSVRLSEPFTDYDKAFYDFFFPKRLGKLDLDQVRKILERLADANNAPDVKKRLQDRPSRIEALFELTGGNPRALGLIFELLRQGPNGRAIEDFERLMDITTPYYKARFEELSEQAQVVMHAMAVHRPGNDGGLRFGHTASELGVYARLATNTISAQLDILEREGLVEKSTAHGRNQYRISEQLFRLWLQMRSTRRIRQNVIGLAEFIEAMFDLEELQTGLRENRDARTLADAQFAFAVADTRYAAPLRQELEAHGTDLLLQHVEAQGGDIDDYLTTGDLPEDLDAIVRMRDQLRRCSGGGLSMEEQEALLGSLELKIDQKKSSVNALFDPELAHEEATRLRARFDGERRRLLHYGLHEIDLALLFRKRTQGKLSLPWLTPQEVEAMCSTEVNIAPLRAAVWRLVGARHTVKFANDDVTEDWLNWGLKYRNADDSRDSTEWANVAGAMRLSRRWSVAKQVMEHALSIGESSRASYERGIFEKKNGDLKKAEASFKEAMRLDPTDSWPWNAMGNLLANRLNYPDEAATAYRKATELDPENALPWSNLGNLLADRLSRPEEAEAAYRKAIEIDPAYARAWGNLGNLLADRLSRPEEAEAAYRKAIEIDPAYAPAWNNLGTLLTKQLNRLDEAETAYRKAIEIDPAYTAPWRSLGTLLANQLNRPEEAETAYRKAIEIGPAYAPAWNNLGVLLANRLKRPEEAEAAYRKAIELDPVYALPWRNLGALLANRLNRPEDAEAAYRKAIEIDPAHAPAWNNLGNLLADRLSRFEDAERAYRKAIEINPAYAPAWNNLGNLLVDGLSRPDEAEAAYRKAIEIDPAYAPAWSNLGNLLVNGMNRPEDAEVAYRKAIEASPQVALPWNNLGNVLSDRLNRPEEAETAYRKAVEIDPAFASAWNNLGNLLVDRLSRPEDAEAAFHKAIEIDPAFAPAWSNLGNLLADQLNRPEDAETAFRKAVQIDPVFAPAWSNLGTLLANRLKQPEDAETAFRKAVEIDPTLAPAWNNLGNLLADGLSRPEDAEAAYRKAIESNPEIALPWNNLGNLLTDELSRPEDAEAAYRKAIEIDPEIAPAWNNLANLLANRLNRPEEAETAFRKAVESDPANAVLWINMGKFLEERNRMEEAYAAYAQGAELDADFLPYSKKVRVSIQTRECINEALKALQLNNHAAAAHALARLLAESIDIASALVSRQFIEEFLLQTLTDRQQATTVLNAMRDLHYEKHARPLLLAFEAVKDNRPEMLDELEPEIQGAAKRMYERLHAHADVKTS